MKINISLRILVLILISGIGFLPSLFSQADSSEAKIQINGFAEVYYSYDFGNPDNHNRPAFFYNHNRHNEFNLNLGFIKAAYNSDRVRANIALAAGTYVDANYAAISGSLQNVFEANAGFKLCRNTNLWLDAGIMPSHIGFETAIATDNWTLSRSLLADNSPYYETGAKLSYTTSNGKILLSGLILNGWQNIHRRNAQQQPAFGVQITYKPTSSITLNYSNYIGTERPDTIKQYRYYHNFYTQVQLLNNFHVIAGFDYGAEQTVEGSDKYNTWYSPVLMLKFDYNDKMSVAFRGEYFRDKNGVVIPIGTTNGFQAYSYSLNVDYKIRNNMLWRLEGRLLNNKDEIFILDDEPSQNNFFATTAFAISF